jgi:glycerophosphoryl diester phosphodiesterase
MFTKPIAHRGLHNVRLGIIENSTSAAQAAMTHNYAIECDVQISKDGEAMVFHDFALDRLTSAKGEIQNHTSQELCALSLLKSADKIPTLEQFIKKIAGKTPLIIEIKSQFNGDLSLTHRVAAIVSETLALQPPAFIAVKSFDPACIIELRRIAPHIPRGIVGMSHYECDEFTHISNDLKHDMINLHHFRDTHPNFISWRVHDLEKLKKTLAKTLAKNQLSLPILAWTIRTQADLKMAKKHANQIIFESFTP